MALYNPAITLRSGKFWPVSIAICNIQDFRNLHVKSQLQLVACLIHYLTGISHLTWCSWRQIEFDRPFGIKRATVYTMLNQGVIKSVSLRRRGQQKGVRLIHLQSVSDYLYKVTGEQNGESRDEYELP
jgi:hypothetical protein